jgi:uncharacterized membrane protein (DUF106 family)
MISVLLAACIMTTPTVYSLISTPLKKRKNAVQESVEARDIRTNDQQRVQDQERRRSQLMQLQRTVMSDGQAPPMIVNVSKFEHQDLVYVNTRIATKIKPHQLEGAVHVAGAGHG